MTIGRKLPRLDRVQVFDIGSKGLSVGKAADGRMVFMSDAVPGDVVDVQVLKKRKQFYQFATIGQNWQQNGVSFQ